MKTRTLPFLFSLGLTLGASGVADAAVINFNGIAAPGSFTSYGTGPLTLSGVTFTGNGSMFVVDPGYYSASYANGGFLTSDYAVGGDVINVSLPELSSSEFRLRRSPGWPRELHAQRIGWPDFQYFDS